MKYHLEIPNEKKGMRFTKLFSKDAPYLLDSYYCKENKKWYLVRRKNLLPEIATLIIAFIGMLALMTAVMLFGRLVLPKLGGEFKSIPLFIVPIACTFIILYKWLPTVWLSKAIGIEVEECDEQQAASQHEQYLAAIDALEKKSQSQRELIVFMVSFTVFILAFGVFWFLVVLGGRFPWMK